VQSSGRQAQKLQEVSVYSFLFKRGFILPVTVTGLVPAILAFGTAAWTRATPASLVGGALFVVFGLAMLVSTTQLFARNHGSLAPWNPPTLLVVSGPYRFCRNPMITGIYAILAGETLALQSPWLLGWALMFIVGMSSHIFFQEEPLLQRRFGEAYTRYSENVPRWVPRLKPYQPSQ
jgi:protein-S-isoprenylcysteine O-methyltransferase Ste14